MSNERCNRKIKKFRVPVSRQKRAVKNCSTDSEKCKRHTAYLNRKNKNRKNKNRRNKNRKNKNRRNKNRKNKNRKNKNPRNKRPIKQNRLIMPPVNTKLPVISDNQVCAMSLPAEKQLTEVCQSDNGGPLTMSVDPLKQAIDNLDFSSEEEKQKAIMGMYMDPEFASKPKQHVLVGIASWNWGCGRKYPAVYGRVSSYVDWIKEHAENAQFI